MLKKKFPKINRVIKVFRNKENFQFEGWDMYLKLYSPWDQPNKNLTFDMFEAINNKIYKLVESKKFILSQFPNSHDIFDVLNGLRWRHYLIVYTSYLAISRTKSKNLVECGVCDGLTMFYAFNSTQKFNCHYYLYDSWDAMREQDLIGKEKGQDVHYNRMKILIKKIKAKDFHHRITELGLRPDRADVIIHASKIYLDCMKWSKCQKILVPQSGLADGIIDQLYNNYN